MNRPEQVSAVVWLSAGVAITLYTLFSLRIGSLWEPGPGFFPLVAGVALTCLALSHLLRTVFAETPARGTLSALWEDSNWRKVCSILGGLLVSFFIFKTVGYLLTTAVLVVFLLVVIGDRSWKYALCTAVLMSVCTYVLFYHILKVELPKGFLGL